LFEQCRELFTITESTFAIDIGSNDGTLLSNFKKGGCRVLGIEPTDKAQLANSRGIDSFQAFFSKETSATVRENHGRANIITAANVFAHMKDVDEIMHGILELLGENGVFISESHYLLDLIRTLQFDTIYHEHLRYYSLHALKYLFEKHGLEIFRVKRIPTHGGSIRVFAARKGQSQIHSSVPELLAEEKNAGLLNLETYRGFARDVMQSKLDLLTLIGDIQKKGHAIYGIGAPSRASTLITYTGLDHEMVNCILEIKGSYKIDKYMPGTLIPVLEESKLFEDQPEYALLFSWHIAEELIPKLTEKGFRGDYIVPLPTPRIIKNDRN
ncbi:MAG: class I SAM-dependent methyltransferase, partial [bacterium]|nr:class I SAM-dependent methyltransferase [bacterium]